jgi:hypothetical protein
MVHEENPKNKNNILDSGFTRYQTEYALKKGRIGYNLSNKENNLRKEVLCMLSWSRWIQSNLGIVQVDRNKSIRISRQLSLG